MIGIDLDKNDWRIKGRKPRQIDLPDDVRAKFPESLGTLKHIKVLTNAEFGELQPKKVYNENDEENERYLDCCNEGLQEKAIDWRRRSRFCIHSIMDYEVCNYPTHDHVAIKRNPVCIKNHTLLNHKECLACPDYEEGQRWRLRRSCCTYFINYRTPRTSLSPEQSDFPLYSLCLHRFVQNPRWNECAKCQNHQPRSTFKLVFHFKPIDTGDIPIPTIHFKRPRQQREKVDDDLWD